MKSLSESLFDKDLVQKDLPTFGDVYKPVRVSSTNSDYPYKKIANMFVGSKLKNTAKPLSLSDVNGFTSYPSDSKSREIIELIAGMVADIPLTDEMIGDKHWALDEKEKNKLFAPLVRQPYWRNGIYINLSNSFTGVSLEIIRSSRIEFTQITIKYEKA